MAAGGDGQRFEVPLDRERRIALIQQIRGYRAIRGCGISRISWTEIGVTKMHFCGWIQSVASYAGTVIPFLTHPYFLVGVGGAFGSILRYGVGRLVALNLPGANSLLGTASVNVLGSFVLGSLMAFFGGSNRAHPGILLLGVGVCGGFTTFSTLAMELVDLMHGKQYWGAVGYGLGSLVSGMVGFFAGAWVVQRWIMG